MRKGSLLFSWEPSHTSHLNEQGVVRMKGGKGTALRARAERARAGRLTSEPPSPQMGGRGSRLAVGPAAWPLTTRGRHSSQFRYGVGSLGPEPGKNGQVYGRLVAFLVGRACPESLLSPSSTFFSLGLS